MGRVIKAEMYKVFHNKTVLMAIALLLIFLIAPLFISTESAKAFASSGVEFFHKGLSSSLVYILLIVIAAITSDYTLKTIKNLVCSGVSRVKIYFGRYFSAFFVSLIVLLVYMAVGTIAFSLKYGFGAAVDSTLILTLVESLALQILYLANVVAVGYLLASIFRKAIFPLGISLAYFEFGSYLFMFLDYKFKLNLPLYGMDSVLKSIISLKLGSDFFIQFTIFTLATALILSTIGAFIFKKRDVR